MERFAIGSVDALLHELLRLRVSDDVMHETLRILDKARLNPYQHAYAIDDRTVYVIRPPVLGRTRPLYLGYVIDRPRPTDPEGIAGVLFPVAGGFADTVFTSTFSAVLVAKGTGRPIAAKDADQYPPPELQAAVRRALKPRHQN